MGKTLFDKVWERHVIKGAEGEAQLLYIDLMLIHEVTSPRQGLRAGRTVRPEKKTGTMDYNVPTVDICHPYHESRLIPSVAPGAVSLERNFR